MRATAPNRTNCVDDVPGWQPIASREFGITSFATSQQTALMQELRSGGSMNRSVNPTTAQ